MSRHRICLVSPGHIASNPRLVKEANSLQAAGYHVRVVAGDYMAAIRPLDKTILSAASWSYTPVGLGSRANYLRRRLQQEIARSIARTDWIPTLSIATWAHSPVSMQLAKAAAAAPADLYIAHNLAALPAAAIAAQRYNARLGFDAEDFHVGELLDTPDNQLEIAVRDRLERTLLPRCQHLTAASPMIADAYSKRYGVTLQPTLNVFLLTEALIAAHPSSQERVGIEPSLYWFSQTIGPGRGLEAVIRAMGQMQTRVRLHLRGIPAAGYAQSLIQLAQTAGVGDRVHLLPPAPPSEMVRLAACHDIGLSLELVTPMNRAICLTNKIFAYLLAGLPVLVSHTPAQSRLAEQLGEATALVDMDDERSIATALDAWCSDPTGLAAAKAAAWSLGQTQYNWDLEQNRFLEVVKRALK